MLRLSPLQPALDRFRSDWEARVGTDTAGLVARDFDNLRSSGLLDRHARPGDRFPVAVLTDAGGAPFDLALQFAQGPAIVTFYRGGWCPYCNLELRAYQQKLPAILRAGGAVIAISPERPRNVLDTVDTNRLTFPVLSDNQGALANALGISFEVSADLRPFYDLAGHPLPGRNGDGIWVLPVPATFVVARGGEIAASFVEPDYRRRLDPAQALAVLENLTLSPLT
jgi:peroxiredoxin